MKSKSVLAEVDSNGEAIRIFRTVKEAVAAEIQGKIVHEMSKASAVGSIRSKVFERATNSDGFIECEDCGKLITEHIGHMHERHFKGKRDENGDYGEVSVENGCAICYNCHLGPNGHHGDRRWQTSKLKSPLSGQRRIV